MACAQALHRVSNNYYYYIINAEVLPLPGSRGRADREAERQPGGDAEALLLPVSHESNNFYHFLRTAPNNGSSHLGWSRADGHPRRGCEIPGESELCGKRDLEDGELHRSDAGSGTGHHDLSLAATR